MRSSLVKVDHDTTWLNHTKVIAICAVMAIHTFGYNAVVEHARTTKLGMVSIGVHATSVFSVALFVMVSGALLLDPSRYTTARPFLAKRAARLLPALVFWHVYYFFYRTLYLGQAVEWDAYIVQMINGRAFQALYYFWLILGLVAITPILIPWISQTRKRYVAVAGFAMASMPILTLATHGIRGRSEIWIETAWTWWIFYLGFYLLGWALRDVVLPKRISGLAIGVVILLAGLGIFVWRNPAAPPQLSRLVAGYYSMSNHIYTPLIFVLAHSLTANGRSLNWIVRGWPARVIRELGAVSLGVFAVHTSIILVVIRSGILGEGNAAPRWEYLLARYVLVVSSAFAISLTLRRIPFFRRVV